MSGPSDLITMTARQQRFASYAIDVLVYVTVLNLFVEYADAIVIDSFTISIFTAFVLKVLLDLIMSAEHRVSEFFAGRELPLAKVLRVLAVWFILFSSKFVILEVIDLIFGDHVELGGFLEVVALVVALIVAQKVFERIYQTLGESAASAS